MIRSFLKVFLPEDEYKRTRILYFMAETTFLTVGILLLLGLLKYVLHIPHLDTEFILLLSPFLMVGYPYFRYILSGIEHTEVSSKKDYKRGRHVAAKRALLVGVLFFIIILLVKGFPDNYNEGLDLIALPIIFSLIYYVFDLVSLRQSIKKNKELDD